MQEMSWEPLHRHSLWQNYQRQNVAISYSEFSRFLNEHISEQVLWPLELHSMHNFNESLEHAHPRVLNLFYLLCCSGGIYALCSGFDGMIAVLSTFFQELYLGIVIGLAVLSALSALGIFIARDRPSILESLGLKSYHYQSVIDEYLFSLQSYIHQKKQAILHREVAAQRPLIQELKTSSEILETLLTEKQHLNELTKNSWSVYLQSNFAMFVGGILFCSDGFFVGQNVMQFLFSQSPQFILVFSLMVAACALASYAFVECSSLKEYLYDHLFTDQMITVRALEENHDDLAFFELVVPGR